MFGPFKKEKPLLGLTGMGGGAATYFVKQGGYTNPGEWTRVLNQPGDPASAGAYVTGTIDTSGYRALLIFGISGGGGGGANGNDNGAGGGGGGAYVAGHVADVTDVDEVTYRVPGGGAGGTGDAHGPPTGWPARQNGGDSPTLGLGPPTSYNDLFAVSGAEGGRGGYVMGGSGNLGGEGAGDGGYPTGTAGGDGARNISCDNPPDGGNPGAAIPAANGGGGGGGAGGTWCGPTPGRSGTPGYNSSIGGPNTISTWTLPPAFPVGGGSPYPLDVTFESHGSEGTYGGPGSPPAPPGTPKAPAEGGDGISAGSGGGGAGGGVSFFDTGNGGYGGGGGGAASRGGDAASGGDGGAGYLIVYAQ